MGAQCTLWLWDLRDSPPWNLDSVLELKNERAGGDTTSFRMDLHSQTKAVPWKTPAVTTSSENRRQVGSSV